MGFIPEPFIRCPHLQQHRDTSLQQLTYCPSTLSVEREQGHSTGGTLQPEGFPPHASQTGGDDANVGRSYFPRHVLVSCLPTNIKIRVPLYFFFTQIHIVWGDIIKYDRRNFMQKHE